MEVDVEPCCSSKKDSTKSALINCFGIRNGCEPSFMKKCWVTIRPLMEGETSDATISVIDLPIQYLEKLLFRTKSYEKDPLNENECVDIFSAIIFSNNPFVSRNYNEIIVLQDITLTSNPFQTQPIQAKHFHYFIPSNAIHYLSDYCPFGVEVSGKFEPFNYIVFKNYHLNDESLFQQAAKIMGACRKNELYFQYTANVFLTPIPLKELECGLSVFEGFEMKPTKIEKDNYLYYQICSIQKVFFTPLSVDLAIQKCFEFSQLRKAFSHHCSSFQFKDTAFDICEITFFDENAVWKNDENLYKISVKEKYANEMIHIWGPKYFYENYPFEEFQIIPFQQCSHKFWPSGVVDFVQKSNFDSPKSFQQKISSIICELNFLNNENDEIRSNWYTEKIEILPFPSILFRTQSIVACENGKFDYSINSSPLIYGTKASLIILFSNEAHLQIFKPLINSLILSVSYRSFINVKYQRIKNTVQIHAEIIKCNVMDEMLIIIDGGNIFGLGEIITFAKTKKPDAAIFVLTMKKLKKLLIEKETRKFQRIFNFKMGGLNHTPNYNKFLAINTIDIKPNEILFLSHFFLPPQSSNIVGTTGFAFNYMPIKCQAIGRISFQFTNRTQFYSLHKFCEFLKSKIEQHSVNFPKIVFVGTIDKNERKEICEFNAKMDLNIIQKHFIGRPILIYLSFTKEHTFQAFDVGTAANLPIGACIDDPIEENCFYLVTQKISNSFSEPLLKVRILLNQPGLSKAAIKYYIFTQCFCNQIILESDPFPATIMYSIKLAKKGVKVIEALKNHSPTSFSGNAEDDARYCNKAIAFQNIKYQCMDIDVDDVENDKKVVKSRKGSNQQQH